MPSFDFIYDKLRYTASDETILDKAVKILGAIYAHDQAMKQDAGTALNALAHVQEYVKKQRAPKAEPATK